MQFQILAITAFAASAFASSSGSWSAKPTGSSVHHSWSAKPTGTGSKVSSWAPHATGTGKPIGTGTSPSVWTTSSSVSTSTGVPPFKGAAAPAAAGMGLAGVMGVVAALAL